MLVIVVITACVFVCVCGDKGAYSGRESANVVIVVIVTLEV